MGGPSLDILLVEDNADHAELVRRTLSDRGVTRSLLCVSDGEKALDYLLRRGDYAEPAKSPRPRFVLLDLRLPKKDAFDVLRQLRGVPDVGRIPVVVLSTSEAPGDIYQAYRCGANSYLVKPIDFHDFNEMLCAAAAYWLSLNRSPVL